MKLCPHCGKPLSSITPTLPTFVRRTSVEPEPPAFTISEEILVKLRPKLADLASRISTMSEIEYGEWVDALPPDEFLAFISLAQDERRFADILKIPTIPVVAK